MGLLDEICEKRSRLCHTTTVVTTPAGKVFKEEVTSDGVRMCVPSTSEPGRCPGFIIDTKPDLQVAEVISGLCLGSQDATQESGIMRKHCVTDIISLGIDVPQIVSPVIHYHFVSILDMPETDLNEVCLKVLPLIHNLLIQNKVLFIHCNAGVSRSPAIVIAYLMKFRSMSFSDAFGLVKSKRPVINPNFGFIKQLKTMETMGEC